jgi:endoglucanase
MKPLLALAFPIIGIIATASSAPWIRVNQLGYLPGAIKVAVLVDTAAVKKSTEFGIHDALSDALVYRSTECAAYGAYGPFRASWRLTFSGFREPGAYYITCAGTRSPVFRIAADVYDGAADHLLQYMRQQRSGYNPFLNDSCHTRDGYVIYGGAEDSTFVDVAGGWHDASDYLQYVTTSANAVVQMLFAWEQNPDVFADLFGANGRSGANGIADILDEARWGIMWLLKMNPAPGVMYNQLADDRDHRGFRLPTLDTVSYGRGTERPVYRCTGLPQGLYQYQNRTTGIASTAAKYASAFALGSILFHQTDRAFALLLGRKAIEAYAYAAAHPGVCQTAPCRAPYFYEEDNWVDDMELAAAQLFRLTGEERYATDLAVYAAQEPVTPWMGADAARHYQWYPFVNLGHFYGAKSGVERERLAGYMKEGLERVHARGKRTPFLFGIPFIWCSNNLVSALLTQARCYRELTGDNAYAEMEASLRDWLFGCNPWGTSMIVGLPKDGVVPRDPHSAFTHVNGLPIDGGLVDGPVYGRIFASLKGVRLAKADDFAPFQSDLAVYHDDWADYSTNEPTMDGTASLTYYLSALQKESGDAPAQVTLSHGAITRLDSTSRTIALVFTGHEFADGGETIRRTLAAEHVKASFFFTGDFYRRTEFAKLIGGLKRDGHYLGAHSDKHLLYASWERRDSLLVTREDFEQDLRNNYRAMERFGVTRKDAPYFLPPFEWYNSAIARWTASLGLTLVNFTPGTSSNADYTIPSMGARYLPSDSIMQRVLAREAGSATGLNGHILLLHIGTDPSRTDKFHAKLGTLIRDLKRRGYTFRRL